jgi:hypothetical protein
MNYKELKKYRTQLLHHADLLNIGVLNDPNYMNTMKGNSYVEKILFGLALVKQHWLEEQTTKKRRIRNMKNVGYLDTIMTEIKIIDKQINEIKGR